MTQALVKLTLALVFAVLALTGLLDWMGGCGESFVYADGSRHLGECIGRDILKSIFLEVLSWIHVNNG
jgi:hypothetical protein